MYALAAPDFFALAFRITAYPSVMRVRLDLQEQEKHQPQQQAPAPQGGAFGELTEEQVEAIRQQQRIRDFPKALRPGEVPQHVSPSQLIRETT